MSQRKNPSRTATPAEPPERPRKPRSPRQGMLARGTATPPLRDAHDLQDHAGMDDGDTQFVSAVARAAQVLNAFRPNDPPLGNVELAERTGLAKPTVSRLAYTLSRCGFLSFNPRFRVYELGPAAVTLGHVAMSAVSVRRLARPLMQQLADHTNFNVGLGTFEQTSMVYTDAFEGGALVGVRLFAGSRLPVLSSAMGRAYLAGLGADARAATLDLLSAEAGGLGRAQMKSLDKAMAEFDAHGFCASVGEWQRDIHAVSAPIRSPSGGPTYAVNLGGPSYMLPEKALRTEIGPRVVALARRVEAALSPWVEPPTPEAKP